MRRAPGAFTTSRASRQRRRGAKRAGRRPARWARAARTRTSAGTGEGTGTREGCGRRGQRGEGAPGGVGAATASPAACARHAARPRFRIVPGAARRPSRALRRSARAALRRGRRGAAGAGSCGGARGGRGGRLPPPACAPVTAPVGAPVPAARSAAQGAGERRGERGAGGPGFRAARRPRERGGSGRRGRASPLRPSSEPSPCSAANRRPVGWVAAGAEPRFSRSALTSGSSWAPWRSARPPCETPTRRGGGASGRPVLSAARSPDLNPFESEARRRADTGLRAALSVGARPATRRPCRRAPPAGRRAGAPLPSPFRSTRGSRPRRRARGTGRRRARTRRPEPAGPNPKAKPRTILRAKPWAPGREAR